MKLVVVLEELAGQHQDLAPPSGRRLPYCKCGGEVIRGEDSCVRCGRYKRGLFVVGTVDHDLHLRGLAAFMRERPHAA